MSEWSKVHDWKSCIVQKAIGGSNPPPSVMSIDYSKSNNKNSYELESVVNYYAEFSKQGLFEYEKVIVGNFFKRGSKVLDIACGTGRTTKALKDFGFDCIGIDFSSSMIKKAKLLYKDIDFRVLDATCLDIFDANTFDNAFFSYNGLALLTFYEKEKAFFEISRVLKDNGNFVFTTPLFMLNNQYVINKAKEKNIDLTILKNRIDFAKDEFLEEGGGKLNLHLPFYEDIVSLCKKTNFKVIFETTSYRLSSNHNNLHDTNVIILKKV